MSHEDKREARTKYLIYHIEKPKFFRSSWNEKDLISATCLEFNAGSRYIKEIINDLVNTKRICRFSKKVMSSDVFNAEFARRKELFKTGKENK